MTAVSMRDRVAYSRYKSITRLAIAYWRRTTARNSLIRSTRLLRVLLTTVALPTHVGAEEDSVDVIRVPARRSIASQSAS